MNTRQLDNTSTLEATNYSMVRGDTFVSTVQVLSNCLPLNITGYLIWFTVRAYIGDCPQHYLVEARSDDTPTSLITVIDALTGKIKVTMPASATNKLPSSVTTLRYDIQIKDTSNIVSTVQIGTITLSIDETLEIT
jgi:hypothetical protein